MISLAKKRDKTPEITEEAIQMMKKGKAKFNTAENEAGKKQAICEFKEGIQKQIHLRKDRSDNPVVQECLSGRIKKCFSEVHAMIDQVLSDSELAKLNLYMGKSEKDLGRPEVEIQSQPKTDVKVPNIEFQVEANDQEINECKMSESTKMTTVESNLLEQEPSEILEYTIANGLRFRCGILQNNVPLNSDSEIDAQFELLFSSICL